MLEIDIERLFPRFILNDKNGHALAKAIEKGMTIFVETIQDGTDRVLDVDKMPEWRLDELAWEYGCLYDYTADVEAKREWIRQATSMYSIMGTAEGIYQYLRGYFEDVKILERWQFGGEPHTFRIATTGSADRELENWTLKAAEEAKNVRSVLDRLTMYQPLRNSDTMRAATKAHITQLICATIPKE